MTERGGCPICHKAVDPAYHPFCSKRCSDVDLGRWLKGHYTIPTAEPAPDSEREPD